MRQSATSSDEAGAVIRPAGDQHLISVQIAPEYRRALDPGHLHSLVIHTLAVEGRIQPLEVGVTVTSDEEIHGFNKQYLDHDYPTDVLSFGAADAGMPHARRGSGEQQGSEQHGVEKKPPTETEYVTEGFEGDTEVSGAEQSPSAEESEENTQTAPVAFVTPPGWPSYLGDVVISYETAAAQAGDYSHSPAAEVDLLLVHGLLHLLGYDDHDPAATARMRARQDELITSFEL